MSDDKKIHELFQSQRREIPDNGFSQRVMKDLPKKNSLLPKIIIPACFILGCILTFIVQSPFLFLEQLNDLGIAISQFRIPSASSVITYFIGLLIFVSIGLGMYQIDTKS